MVSEEQLQIMFSKAVESLTSAKPGAPLPAVLLSPTPVLALVEEVRFQRGDWREEESL